MLLLDEIPQVTELEDQVLKYMNPNVAADRMSAQWPLSRMQDAALLGGGYLVCTVLGALFMKLFISGTGDKNPFDRLARLIQPLYNIVQVFLCAYMTVRAVALPRARTDALGPVVRRDAYPLQPISLLRRARGAWARRAAVGGPALL